MALASVVSPASAQASDPGTAQWERVPRDQVAAECGMDPDMLEQATLRLNDTPFVVIRYGKLCWEGGYPGGTTDTYNVFSITKTMGGLLTGMVDSRSGLDDTDPVTDWIPPDDMGDINPEAKIAHVLAMASTNEDLSAGNKEPWTYDTFGNREISRLVNVMDRAIAGEPENFPGSADAQELAQRELFEPLGMEASSWPGEQIGGNMRSSVHDTARMGELILQRGRYDGKQVLDEEFVYKMTHPSFEDSNTGFGYLTYANAVENWVYSTGTNDTQCSPFTRWPDYPHGPFFEAQDPNGGFVGEQKHDIGLVWAAGAGGQKMSVHRGLDMVIAVRDDSLSVGESEPVGLFEGHKNVWNAIRPSLVALDPVYQGDEEGFCAAYASSAYAPDLLEPWFQPARSRPAAPGEAAAPAEVGAPASGAAPAAGAPAGAAQPAAGPAPAVASAEPATAARALPATGSDAVPVAAGILCLLSALVLRRRRRGAAA
jgi:LPXTG-motif cell wall-anchored protein